MDIFSQILSDKTVVGGKTYVVLVDRVSDNPIAVSKNRSEFLHGRKTITQHQIKKALPK